MDVDLKKKEIKLSKTLTFYDDFVIEFISILNSLKIKYVIISGYVVLLFGRPRLTEDIDIFLEDLDESRLKQLFEVLQKDYWIMNASSFDAAKNFYNHKDAWRVSKKNEIFPNMEVKRLKSDFDYISLNNSIKVTLNEKFDILISPLELQIAYKLYLGSSKDLEDARYLNDLFKDKLDNNLLESYARELKIKLKDLVS